MAASADGSEVYAVLAPSPEDALSAVGQAMGCEPSQLVIVGGLARGIVRRLKLKAGEVRAV